MKTKILQIPPNPQTDFDRAVQKYLDELNRDVVNDIQSLNNGVDGNFSVGGDLSVDGSAIIGGRDLSDKRGQILETFSLVCAGQSITVPSGTYTSEYVMTHQYLTSIYSDILGSKIEYKPPVGTRIVIYKFKMKMAWHNARPIMHFRLYLDSTEVLHARFTSEMSYEETFEVVEWPFHIAETANSDIGQVTSWNALKEIKLMGREYDESYQGRLHGTAHYDGAISAYLSRPIISITAIG
jgi:hypothetical protein